MAPSAASCYLSSTVKRKGSSVCYLAFDLADIMAGLKAHQHIFPYQRMLCEFFLNFYSKTFLKPHKVEHITKVKKT